MEYAIHGVRHTTVNRATTLMCTALFGFGIHSTLAFFLGFNRDEFLDRLTAPLHWWEDAPEILAGRDLERKGTWLGISRSGRFAFLTNFREPNFSCPGSKSRGDLPVNFLKGRQEPLQYLQSIDAQAYSGFNLVVGQIPLGPVAYLTNRGATKGPVALEPGLYGLSNGNLSSEWPKTELGKSRLKALLEKEGVTKETFPWEKVFDDVFGDTRKIDNRDELPETGMGSVIEYNLSSILLKPMEFKGRQYGTRSKTVILGWDEGLVQVKEATLSKPGSFVEEELVIGQKEPEL